MNSFFFTEFYLPKFKIKTEIEKKKCSALDKEGRDYLFIGLFVLVSHKKK